MAADDKGTVQFSFADASAAKDWTSRELPETLFVFWLRRGHLGGGTPVALIILESVNLCGALASIDKSKTEFH